MGGEFPDLTLFLGPQTRSGLALNLAVRNNRPAMIKAGLRAHPTRIASPALRALADQRRSVSERNETFAAMLEEAPAFHAALNMFAPSHKGFTGLELFPDSVFQLAALGDVAEYTRMRVIVTPDWLPDYFLAAASPPLETRVRGTGWEVLYELNWVDLVADICSVLPKADVLVLTPRGLALGLGPLGARLFGPGAVAVAPSFFLREALDVTGQAVLDRMEPGAPLSAEVAADLYASFAVRADREMCRERLGLDRQTLGLLATRFDEDMAEIAGMDRAEVV